MRQARLAAAFAALLLLPQGFAIDNGDVRHRDEVDRRLAERGGACFERHAEDLEHACQSRSEEMRMSAALTVTECRLEPLGRGTGCWKGRRGGEKDAKGCASKLRNEEWTTFSLVLSQLDGACEEMRRAEEERKTQHLLRELSGLGPEILERHREAQHSLEQGQVLSCSCLFVCLKCTMPLMGREESQKAGL